MQRAKLGEVLKGAGALSDWDLSIAIKEQKDRSILLGELLFQKGLVSKTQLAAALQEVTRIPYVDCQTVKVEQQALEFMTQELALRYCCLPVAFQGQHLIAVMKEPQNLQLIEELRFITGIEISPRLGFQDDIEAAIQKYFSDSATHGDEVWKEALQENQGERLPSSQGVTSDLQPPIVPDDHVVNLPDDKGKSIWIDQKEIVPDGKGTSIPEMEFFTDSSREGAKEAIEEFKAAMGSKQTPAVRFVTQMLTSADTKKASDIHIDPQATDTVIRLRVDGILHDLLRVPKGLNSQLVSRIKVLGDMDIAERRAPQDGRFLVRIGNRKLDIRVSTLPTHFGEKVVMRLLSPDFTRSSFLDLGFSEEQSQALSETLTLPQGLILVCGPTGSGKTTTLYSALEQLSARSVNVITVEDPIEYVLPGINQVQVNKKAGLTFASSLRSILRQDPNIVMLGEIRDRETAEIALTAAQTGHLVLSTLHTNDSVAALDRLRDLDIPAFMIASSVTAIVAQRLVRKLCSCRTEQSQSSYSARASSTPAGVDCESTIYFPAGCEACDNTGYKGRIGVCEVLIITDEIARLIHKNAGADEIRTLLAGSAIRFMKEDALDKVKRGLTSMAEVRRIIPMKESAPLRCHICSKQLQPGFMLCPYCGSNVSGIETTPKNMELSDGGIRQ